MRGTGYFDKCLTIDGWMVIMEQMPADGLVIYYEPEDRAAAAVIRDAAAATAHLLHAAWGLRAPADCRIYVMASLESYLRHAPPPAWRALITVLGPLVLPRFRRLWPVAGGWAQRYGRRHTVGIKPPRLIAIADRSVGQRLFVQEESPEEKTRHLTAHELTHAFSAHLRLPVWLHEGIAMLAVDKLLEKPSVLPESVRLLADVPDTRLRGYGSFKGSQQDALVRLYARSYWLTRYLSETQPALLRSLLQQRHSKRAIDARLAATLNLPRRTLWPEIDTLLLQHYDG